MAVGVIRLIRELPENIYSKVIASQILRSATSVGANYRAASRAKSPADFINKLKIVEEEADETLYWLELMVDCELIAEERILATKNEVNELVAIMVASINTAKRRYAK